MNRIVTTNDFDNKKSELKNKADSIIESITVLKSELENFNETIEAIKLCANTYGGMKKVKELENLDFDTKILEYIENNINSVKINETIKNELRDKSAL